MNYKLHPTLNHIAVLKLAAVLWNQSDIKECILNTVHRTEGSIKERWQELEKKVEERVLLLPLPELLKKELVTIVKPVGFQIRKWTQYHGCTYLGIAPPQEFCWTSYGTIDRKRTAEILVENESIDITTRYKLSCIYCLENSIQELWSKMDECCRNQFEDEDHQELVTVWTNIMKGKLVSRIKPTCTLIDTFRGRRSNHTRSPYQCAFECATYFGNPVAAEYFFAKLSPKERKESLVETAETVAICFKCECLREYGSETLCFLLSKMDNEQQMELFKSVSLGVLICILDWPWQSFFMGTFSIAQKFLTLKSFELLLHAIIPTVKNEHRYLIFREIFAESWQKSPDARKKFIFNRSYNSSTKVFVKLFKIRDGRNIKLIFRDATLKQKKIILYSHNGRDICSNLIDNEEWGLLDYFIRECIASKNEMIYFKKHVEEVIIGSWSKDHIVKNTDKLYKCFQLLDDILCGFDKRKCFEENDINPAKRLCAD